MAKCVQCQNKGLLLKLTSHGLCLTCADKRIGVLEKTLTPDIAEVVDLRAKCEQEREQLNLIKEELENKQNELHKLENKVAIRSKELIMMDDTIEMESFSLYRPKYDFANSDGYKEKLDEIREKQKQMIREKTAAMYERDWVVNNSAAKGRTLMNEMIKLFLRSFNNECDIAIQSVKFNNFDRCVARIEKSFDTINSLGKVNTVYISNGYKKLKLQELILAYEYQCKKQEEKELLAELRAQQREEAKLAKEIEAARKEAEKEKKHFLQALEKIRHQISSASDADRSALIEKQNELMAHLDEINAKMEDIDYRVSNQRAGYVYVISNIGSFGEGVYKIGMTRRLDPMERVYELGDASVPFQFDVHAMIFSDDAPKLEAALHNAFASKRVNAVNPRREYFRVSLEEIKDVVRKKHDKTVEFFDIPNAQQYRESCKLLKHRK